MLYNSYVSHVLAVIYAVLNGAVRPMRGYVCEKTLLEEWPLQCYQPFIPRFGEASHALWYLLRRVNWYLKCQPWAMHLTLGPNSGGKPTFEAAIL